MRCIAIKSGLNAKQIAREFGVGVAEVIGRLRFELRVNVWSSLEPVDDSAVEKLAELLGIHLLWISDIGPDFESDSCC